MRPADLPRATSVRLALLFLTLFGGATLLSMGVIYWRTSHYLTSRVDDLLTREHFRSQLLVSMGWGGLAALVVASIGAVLVAMGAERRIEGVTASLEQIMKGDLTKRLPADGRSGDVDRLAVVVNRLLDEIEHLLGEVKGVADGIAHDLRTPLTRLLAGLERVQRRRSTRAEYDAAVTQAIKEIGGILQTFSALLRISEIEDGARRAGFTSVDLAGVAKDVLEFYEPVAENKGVQLHCGGCAARGALLTGDPSLLFEAIGNLVDNAIKFTPTGGRVEISIGGDPRGPSITIHDTGPGIDPADADDLLKAFRRGERGRQAPGNGLGLALVAAVAKLHGLPLSIDRAGGCRVRLG